LAIIIIIVLLFIIILATSLAQQNIGCVTIALTSGVVDIAANMSSGALLTIDVIRIRKRM